MNESPRAHTHFLGRPIGLVLIVLYKGLWGVGEIFGGLLFVLSERLLATELAEDPQDLFARWMLAHVNVSHADAVRLGLLIMALGLAKLVLAAGIWYRSWFIRGAAITFFSLAGAYAVYHLTQHFSVLTLGATAADLGILWYLWRVLPKHMRDPGVH